MAETRNRRTLAWAAVGLVGVALAAGSYWLLFTTFMLYDDEGYVLLSLRNFAQHGALYDRVYTQYGPFPYLFYDALHRWLAFPFTNTSARWVTGVCWLGTSGFCTALVARVTRSVVWSAFTLTGVFAYLWVMDREPIHPGGLIVLLVSGAAWFAGEAAESRRTIRLAVVTAMIGAALTLTKINVGVFFLASTLVWLALNTASSRAANVLTWLAALGCAALPFALMRTLFDAQWVRLYGLIFICGALAVLLAGRQTASAIVGIRAWAVFAATFVASLALVCLATAFRGTTWMGMLDGIVLEPLRHPGVYFFAMYWSPGAGVVALLSLATAAWAQTNAWRRSPLLETVAWARVLATCLFLCSLLEFVPTTAANWGMSYGVSLAWLFVVPLQSDRRGSAVRTWVALLLVFQFLHSYPIAGSQMNWGTFLFVPLLALGMHDAGPTLTARFARAGKWPGYVAAAGLAAAALVVGGRFVKLGWIRYSTSQPLGLQGAKDLRMPDEITYAMRIADENLRAHGDLLFSVPGLYSANLWTGLPTPTLANATHWFTLLSIRQQQAIVDRLSSASRPVILVQRPLVDYLVEGGFARAGLLQTWIRANFAPAFSLYPYEVWVRRGRTIAALSTAQLFAPKKGPGRELRLTLRAPDAPVAKIEVCDVNNPRRSLLSLDARNSVLRLRSIDLADQPTGEPVAMAFPLRARGVIELDVSCTDSKAGLIGSHSLLVLRDRAGGVLAELRVLAMPAVVR